MEDYVYLADFVKDNSDVINACNGLFINKHSLSKVRMLEEKNPLFSTSGNMFWPSVVTLMIIVAIMCVFGAFYELKRVDYRRRCLLM